MKCSQTAITSRRLRGMSRVGRSPGSAAMTASRVVDLYEASPGVVRLTMQDRAHKNTFSVALVDGLLRAFDQIRKNTDYRVVVLTGYDTYFCSGGTREGLT